MQTCSAVARSVVGTCCAGKVRVDDFLAVRVQIHKHPQDKFTSCNCIPLGAYKADKQGINNYMTVHIGNLICYHVQGLAITQQVKVQVTECLSQFSYRCHKHTTTKEL
jgi:hypothetical protein